MSRARLPTLSLEAVTPENFSATVALAVAPEQERWIAPVVWSLAEAYVWNSLPRAAREGQRLVGFVLVYPFESNGEAGANIVRFMIDRRHQGRGLGKALMAATLDWLAGWERPPSRVRLSTLPDNLPAQHLYRACGFSGDAIEHGEIVMWRALTGSSAPAGS